MPSLAELKPEVTFEQAAPFVRAIGGPEAAAIDPIAQPMVYAEMMFSLSPRRMTAEEKALAKAQGDRADLVRQQLAERRANWGKGQEAIVMGVADNMQLTARKQEFKPAGGEPLPVGLAVAVEGANEQDSLRTGLILNAHASGLLVVKRAVLYGTGRPVGDKEGFGPGKTGFEAADQTLARFYADDPDLLRGRNGKPQLAGFDVVTKNANTRDGLREVWLDATPEELAGNLAVGTSAIYTRFMSHDAAAVATELGISPEQIYVGGVEAPERAMQARNPASYGAEISQSGVSAAYHQAAINSRLG